ncbi:hypothetical protein LTR66_012883 [Elasticomyces elasticus]|nr:hypothetical protein LTR66_012883 [Elasticomyces elasticus]
MPFAQLVIGPPGSGKSTYCDGMHQFMSAIGRKCSVVNLDPANDATSYPCALDVRDLVSLEEIMQDEELGPNGGVLYALEELENNWQWLEDGLKELKGTWTRMCIVWALRCTDGALSDDYILFDCPGQVELFTSHDSLPNVFFRLEKMGYRLTVLHLLDSHTITRPSLYISSLLLCLRSMLHLPFPVVNVLTKIDNLHNAGPLPFNLDFYTEVQDLEYLLPHLEAEQAISTLRKRDTPSSAPDPDRPNPPSESDSKWHKLNLALIQVIQDHGLVGFTPLAVEDKASMLNLLRAIDRASGYAFGSEKGVNDSVWKVAMREGWGGQMDVRDVQERWIDGREGFGEVAGQAAQGGSGDGLVEGVERVGGGDEDEDEEMEEMRRAFEKRNDEKGIRVVRKG